MAISASAGSHSEQDSPNTVRLAPAVADALKTTAMAGAEVLAGRSGLGRPVGGFTDVQVLVHPNELRAGHVVLISCEELAADPAATGSWLVQLNRCGISAVVAHPSGTPPTVTLPTRVTDTAERLGLPLVAAPSASDASPLAQRVLTELLHRQTAALALHRTLFQIVLDGGGLPEVATELARLLGGAVVITSPGGRVLADAGEVSELGIAYDASCFDSGGRLRTEAELTGLAQHAGLHGNHIVVPLTAGLVDHGRIVAFSRRGRLDPDDVPTVERAAAVATVAVTKQLAVRAVESKYQGDFLRDLLDGHVAADLAVSHATGLGWDIDRPLTVLVIERAQATQVTSPPDPQLNSESELLLAACRRVVRPRDPYAPMVGFPREVIVLTGVRSARELQQLAQELIRASEERPSQTAGQESASVSIGVSRIATSPDQIPTAYSQAKVALRVARRRRESPVAHFDGLGVLRLLSLVEDAGELSSFVSETLGDLVGDEPESVDLRRTLQMLLETNLNVAETARLLHFHYNTLRYRITKLERTVGPFTRDANLRLNLHVALHALQLTDPVARRRELPSGEP
jgi:purine catabolism regulator